MPKQKKRHAIHGFIAAFLAAFYGICGIPGASGYAFDQIVPDVRQPANVPEVRLAPCLRTMPLPRAPSPNNGAQYWEPIQ